MNRIIKTVLDPIWTISREEQCFSNLFISTFTTSSRASRRSAACRRLSPLIPSISVIPLMNSSCVTACLELRDMTGFEALMTSLYLSGDTPTLPIISSSVGDLSSSNDNFSLAFWISGLICNVQLKWLLNRAQVLAQLFKNLSNLMQIFFFSSENRRDEDQILAPKKQVSLTRISSNTENQEGNHKHQMKVRGPTK